MIFRVIVFVVTALFIAYAASWLSNQEGVTDITWLGYRAQVNSSMVVVLVVALCVSAILVDRIVRTLVRWPSLFSAGWQARRRAKGELALSLGFVALAAGDNRAAVKQARRAEKLLDKGTLTDLLVAQSSYANGDKKAADRYFKKLANEKQTAYFGQLGLMRLHQHDSTTGLSTLAYQAAEKAFALEPTSAEAAQLILRKALEDSQWSKAIDCLKVYLNQSGGQSELEVAKARDLFVRLSLKLAEISYENDDLKQAINSLNEALSERADFIPAGTFLVKILLEKGDKKAAKKTALKVFLRAPHLSSLEAMRDTRDDNDGQFISYATKQAQQSDRPNDGLLAVAQFALRAGIWASASQLIEQITDSYVRHNEYYLAKADIAKGLEDEEGRQDALQQAANAPRAGNWHCLQCNDSRQSYQFDCVQCGVPGQMAWQQPAAMITSAN